MSKLSVALLIFYSLSLVLLVSVVLYSVSLPLQWLYRICSRLFQRGWRNMRRPWRMGLLMVILCIWLIGLYGALTGVLQLLIDQQ